MSLEEKTNLGILDRLLKRVMGSIRVDLGKPILYIRDRFKIYDGVYVFKDPMENIYYEIPFTREELNIILPSDPRVLEESPFDCLVNVYIECTLKEHYPDKEAIIQCLKNLKIYCNNKKN
mgnify:CR=1 FL=1